MFRVATCSSTNKELSRSRKKNRPSRKKSIREDNPDPESNDPAFPMRIEIEDTANREKGVDLGRIEVDISAELRQSIGELALAILIGHVVSQDKIEVDIDKVIAILALIAPTNVKEV